MRKGKKAKQFFFKKKFFWEKKITPLVTEKGPGAFEKRARKPILLF